MTTTSTNPIDENRMSFSSSWSRVEPLSPDFDNACNKAVWIKSSNESVHTSAGMVMGAESWPALSDSAKASSSKHDGSPVLSSQGNRAEPYLISPQNQLVNDVNPNYIPINAYSPQHQFVKRGNEKLSVNNVPSHAPAMSSIGVEAPSGNLSPRDRGHKMNNWDSGQRGSQSHNNSNSQHRNSFRRGNGSYHNNYGGRREREHDRSVNHDWNHHGNFNGINSQIYPQNVVQRGFVRPQMHTVPLVAQYMAPFGNPIGFAPPPMYIPHDSFRGVPFIAPISPQAMIFPGVNPQLQAKIVTQIDYYFSNENLIKDTYLRQNMDYQGWVNIELISGFKKVRELTDNVQYILHALQASNQVEVQGDKVRRCNDWMRWVMPSAQFFEPSSSNSHGNYNLEMLRSRVEGVTLAETTNHSTDSCPI